jgi:transcription termination factor NusB
MREIVSRIGIVALISTALYAQAAPETAATFQGPAAEELLLKGRIVSSRPLGEGVTRPYRVELEHNGVSRSAIFKSIDVRKAGVTVLADGSSDIDFQDSWQTEIAAYTIDKIIGLGLVPATVERRAVEGKVGSLQFYVEHMSTEADRLEKKQNPPDMDDWNEQIMTTRLFDQLIANVDRHLKNILVTKEFKLRLIDHSRAFRINRSLPKPELLTRFSRSLLEGIKKLEKKDLQKQVGKYLTSGQIDRLLSRRDAILALAAKHVKEKGEAAVLYR